MTRDQFINDYMDRSGLSLEYRTPNGFRLPSGYERIAVPCTCGDFICQGWAMVNPEYAKDIK